MRSRRPTSEVHRWLWHSLQSDKGVDAVGSLTRSPLSCTKYFTTPTVPGTMAVNKLPCGLLPGFHAIAMVVPSEFGKTSGSGLLVVLAPGWEEPVSKLVEPTQTVGFCNRLETGSAGEPEWWSSITLSLIHI